ncbi:MAG: hypothetical protein ACRDHD_04910 [Candidatus Limnocylindria bacterium]
MRGSRALLAILGVAILVGGFSAGRLVGELLRNPRTNVIDLLPTPINSAPTMPASDVPGADVVGLARYPGSVRTAYDRAELGGVVVVTAHYLAKASRDQVRAYYLAVFRDAEWQVADLQFSLGRWTFVVESGALRQAMVEIADRGGLVEIRIEAREERPRAPTPPPRPEPRPAITPPPPPPPPDDDDDDDDDDPTDDDAPGGGGTDDDDATDDE